MQKYIQQATQILEQKKVHKEASEFILENVRDITSIFELTTITRCDKEYFENIIRDCVDEMKHEWFKTLSTTVPFEKPDVKITFNEDEKKLYFFIDSHFKNEKIEYSYRINKILTIDNFGTIGSKSTSRNKTFSLLED